MFIIKNDKLPNMLAELDSNLSTIEVKGESVANLFKSRMILKDLFSSIEKMEEVEKKEDDLPST